MPKNALAQSQYASFAENVEKDKTKQAYARYFKRLADIILSLMGIVLLSPLLVLLALWIKLDSRGPVLFMQKRAGRNKTYFNILKFRTMRTDTPQDVPTHLMEKPEDHITRAGRILRKSSLDELPQLFNILAGHMSVVGPRPALWNQHDLLAKRDRVGANDVRPGLTGWAQINGRDELEIDTKAFRDGEYVQNISLKMDFLCFVYTFVSVLKKQGILEGGTGTMTREKKDLNKEVAVHQ